MKMRKVISAFLVLICIFTAFGLCALGASAAEGARTVYATTNASAKQGSSGYLYVYLDDLTDLSALNVSVYYDTEMITVKSVTNRVSSVVNDLATGDGCVNASYIFDGKGSAAKTNLFYIYYQVNSSAKIGDTYFDIVANEAYNSSLEGMDFTGSRCSLEITEKAVTKSCSITSSSTVSTSVGEEFELSYRLSTYQIASGSMNIHYDSELFEVVSVTNGGFLTDKIADINTALDGTIAISFVGTTYQSKYDVVKVRFKTLKNVTEASDIKLVVTDLYDKELNLYSCSGYTTKASIAFDESYTEDAPSMSVSSSYSAQTDKVTATIKLEKDSMLGAGDFVLKFDTRYLTYISAEKGFSPSFFNINDKDAVDGILKFSIISLSDITDEQIILTVVFDVKHYCQDKTAKFEIGGSGLTDSLVNTIQLNFVDSSVIIPLKHTAATAVEEIRVEPTCVANGSYNSVIYCSECKAELSREIKTIDKLGHDHSTEWTVDVEPTCTTTGSKSHHCSRCDNQADVTVIPANGHNFGEWYTITSPTCIATGMDGHKCSVCQYIETKTTNALGHTDSTAVVENKVDATCTTDGNYDSVVYCSVCNAELSREVKAIEKLGHDYNTTWSTDASSHWHECTKCGDKKDLTSHTAGVAATESTAQVCTVCGYVITPALGHTHNYKTEWSNNATEHWHDCVGCSSIKDNEPHDYTNACDTDCNTCGYVRTITHSYKTEWSSNAEKHWYECSVCGDKSSEANHIPGAEATETTDQVCTVCNFVIQEALGHTHNFNSSKNDETNHWKECACGEKNEITAHTWNNGEVTKEATVDEEGVKTYTCTLCSCTKNESIAKLVTNVKDTESGVTLEIPSNSQATLPAGTVIEVVEKSNESISKQILGEFAATAETVVEALGVYDLNLLLDGVKIQPNGAVVVTLPALKFTAEYDRIIVVFIADDGSYDECKTTVNADGTISFETDHFSKYAVIGVNEEEADDRIGVGAIIAIVVGAVLVVGGGAFAIYWFVIKKKNKPADDNATDAKGPTNDGAEDEQQ